MANDIPRVEIGMMLCRFPDGLLTRGPIGVGTATSVQFPDTCPAGTKVVGSMHTHPKEGGGSILPSTQDIREAQRVGMPAVCIVNNDTSACYRVRGVQAAQAPAPPARPSAAARLALLLRTWP